MENKKIKNMTIIGFITNAVLSVFKIIAGIIGRSGAMIADGIHSISDFLTDIIVLFGLKYTEMPADKDHNYGHNKFATVSIAFISFFLIVAGYEIIKNAIQNIILFSKGNLSAAPKPIALYAAGISIIVKEFLYRYTMYYAKKYDNPMVKANAWHHRSDALSSVAALLGIGAAVIFGGKWTILDPVASIVVSIFIFIVAIQILKPAIDELTERSVPDEIKQKIINLIDADENVLGNHNLRTRNLGKRIVVEAHIFVDKDLSVTESHDITKRIEDTLKAEINENMVITIHIEPFCENKANRFN